MNVAAEKDLVGRLEVSIQESDDRLVRSGKAGELLPPVTNPALGAADQVRDVARRSSDSVDCRGGESNPTPCRPSVTTQRTDGGTSGSLATGG